MTWDSFAYPIRPWASVKIDSLFMGDDYYRLFGKWHRGIDLNGKGGGDTDLGYPVQAMFPGSVVDVGDGTGYGKCVLMRTDPEVARVILGDLGVEGDTIDLFYAHLHQVSVQTGDRLQPGDHLGSLGKTGGSWPAHLHLEVRRRKEPFIVSQSGTDAARAHVAKTCLDPIEILNTLPFTDFGEPVPEPTPAPEPTLEPTPEPAPAPWSLLLKWRDLALVRLKEGSMQENPMQEDRNV